MTTLKDVAKHAGVSIAAASYALNNTGSLSDETRRRVRAAAQELNYHPNAFARRLKTSRIGTIGVFITRFSGSFYEDILEGIHTTVLCTDYELIISPESCPERRILTQRQVDGAIVFDSKVETRTLERLASPQFPIVVLDRMIEHDYVLPLLIDNAGGVRAAFRHLYNQGLRRLAFLAGAPDSFDNHERTQAFLDEASQHGLVVHRSQGNFTEQSGFDAAQEMIERGELPEGIFCANDQMAIGFLKALHAAGRSAPADVAVIGFDDILLARYFQPTLTTVGASRFEWGAQAAAQLIAYLHDHQPFHPIRLPTQLIERASSQKDGSHPIGTT